ncbi:glycosyltransferase [Priestia megaterium]|uniref:glycosyltransferase n=1 Tax=Priestia megaterium TaxID=1404 RepID=UPI0031FD4B8A
MDIILITIGYPYPKKDVFVSNEIDTLSKQFDRVWLLPIFEGALIPKTEYVGELPELPENVYIYNETPNVINTLKLNKKIIKAMIKEWKFNFKYLIKLLRWGFHANFVLNNIENLVKRREVNPSNTILYSFWFHFGALAISCTNDDFILKISRAHGYDLYKEVSFQPYKKYILTKLDAVFACSIMGKNYLNEQYDFSNFHVSYLGTKNSITTPTSINRERGSRFHIISCSRVVEIKRIKKIIDSLSLIRNHKIKWVHIGDGVQLNETIEYARTKFKDQTNIEYDFLGAMSNYEVLTYYQKSEINLFLNVSSTEGLPVSIMEAISFGIPIIATNVGGVAEIISNKINGYLLERDFKDNELADLIINFINMSDSEYKSFCKNARNVWEENFDAKKNYKDFFTYLLSMSESKR